MLKLVKSENKNEKSNYSQEFRESTIKFCIDNSDRSISSIARDLGLNKGTLTLWVNDYKAKNNLLPVNDLKMRL